ncbi:MBL fold metallo-hydrolase [Microvirga pudoricolor]|uniref:MBL fold metallo-hydrolase n=1 Tax=Microvirga pudoricolor TaxID=2778729 RepID=UPI001950E59E|nr:MBL fold metallo-hydrolase [Microvirga pudoricolor]MBM6593843.1 MBL fold metallo-hydrolase [Microvirga pudoricolor]
MNRRAASSDGLQICFWGTRGSTPVSGAAFCEFGGHTPCVEVRCGERLFIVDAGTGLSSLGEAWGDELPDNVDILLSHLHLDHVGGFPFFKPAVLNKDRVIHTWCGHLNGASAEEGLDRLFSPPIFPINLERLPARFRHHGFKAGETLTFRDGTTVETHLLNHPGGATGFRFRHGGRSVCYISDIEHTTPWPDPALVAFVRGADLIIFDGMFTEREYSHCQGWGHSTWQKGVELCQGADVGALAIFHLYPGHNDAYLRKLEAEMQAVMPTAFVARERQSFTLAPRAAEAAPAEGRTVPAGA